MKVGVSKCFLYSWGDHSAAGYLTEYTETDPIYTASPASSVTGTKIDNWDEAFGWGNHADGGYLTDYTETDPIYTASPASSVTGTKIGNWDEEFGWGNHSTVGYMKNGD
jgi:hypothetical protein